MTLPTALIPNDSTIPGFDPVRGGGLSPLDFSDSGFDFSPWEAPHRMTLSIVPDGTDVAGVSSSLYESFKGLMSSAQMEQTIRRAFQAWARRSNLNVGWVSDDGSPLGASGPTQGDTRFGDIRVAAIPMAQDVSAITIGNSLQISGTWSGDVIFNSRAVFQNPEDFYRVAVHEAGHVFGLPHSDTPFSVMNPHPTQSRISREDTAALRAIYGLRRLDLHDVEKSNDSFADATRIDNPGSPHGSNPLVVYGDIQHAADVDVYELDPHSDAAGPLRFQLRSDGRSLLKFQLEVFDENLQRIDWAISTSSIGDNLSVVVPDVDRRLTYYVRVSPAERSAYSSGSYSLSAVFEDQVSASGTALLPEVQQGDYAFLPQGDIRKIFENPQPAFQADLGTNDTLASATTLETAPGYNDGVLYRFDAGLADATDFDFYRFRAPSSLNHGTALTVTLTAFDRPGVVGDLRVFDENGVALSVRTLVNGNGELTVQWSQATADAVYHVQVLADPHSPDFVSGNYRLLARFGGDPLLSQTFARGAVTQRNPIAYHSLFVAETEMFHLGLRALGDYPASHHNLWSTIFDERGQVVYRGVTVAGETRTRQSLILRPGSYLIKTELVWNPLATVHFRVGFELEGTDVNDPTGPELIDVTNLPFQPCTDNPSEYCYPGDNHSPDPYLVVQGRLVPVPNEPTATPPLSDINSWYWNETNSL